MGGLTIVDEPSRLTAVVGPCQGCGACLLTCPEHAIRPEWSASGPAKLLVRRDLCTGCGDCVEVCPVDAIELKGIEQRGLT